MSRVFGPLIGFLVLVSWECTQGSWAHNQTQTSLDTEITSDSEDQSVNGLTGLIGLTVLTPAGHLLGGLSGLSGSISDPLEGLDLQCSSVLGLILTVSLGFGLGLFAPGPSGLVRLGLNGTGPICSWRMAPETIVS